MQLLTPHSMALKRGSEDGLAAKKVILKAGPWGILCFEAGYEVGGSLVLVPAGVA